MSFVFVFKEGRGFPFLKGKSLGSAVECRLEHPKNLPELKPVGLVQGYQP